MTTPDPYTHLDESAAACLDALDAIRDGDAERAEEAIEHATWHNE